MFFITGNPRSGTSLLRLLLTAHPHMHVPPECGFMVWWATKYQHASSFHDENLRDQLAEDVTASKKFEFWNLTKEDVQAIAQNEQVSDYASFCRRLYQMHASKAGKPDALLGDKNNFHIGHIPDIDRLQPNGKYIHIVRDGRDVAASYLALNAAAKEASSQYYPKLARTVGQAADEWSQNVMQARSSLAAIPKDRWLEVRYEDVVRDTVPTLERLCTFLGVKFDPQMLQYHEQNRRHELEPKEFGAWKQRTFQAIDDSAIGRHKKLGDAAISAFNDIAGEPLSLYGYL
ncbi:MAG: sulfotransferase [Pseudomonadota bacterium]